MQFERRYFGRTAARSGPEKTQLGFAPDTRRDPTFFRGEVRQKLAFREAISALHDVVVSDLRYQPRDKTAYLEWRAQQPELDLDGIEGQRGEVLEQLGIARARLTALNKRLERRNKPFIKARNQYFDYLYRTDRDAWWVLDPVITVHPDELFFECFSEDESSYGRLACGYETFGSVSEFECGTTNIDYSADLYAEFQKIRDYKTTALEVDPSGFAVTTDGAGFHEAKIDVPESWVRGFLQVSAAMTLKGVRFSLHPMDVHAICAALRQRKERKGPRSLRYQLTPGEPVRILLEPWNREIVCRRSIYSGPEATEVRVWGRRRLHILERLIPLAKRFDVVLLGTGMPSFYLADMGEMSFTLGLSGWTANDWSGQGNFDLLAPRAQLDAGTQKAVFDRLRQGWFSKADVLAQAMGLDQMVVESALLAWAQAGRVMYDLHRGVYRVRELERDPLPIDALRWANPRESEAHDLAATGGVKQLEHWPAGDGHRVVGKVRQGSGQLDCSVRIDGDERLVDGQCGCRFYFQNRLRKGPCAHLLALRVAFARRRG